MKEDKYKKEMMLLGINRDHPTIASFKPEKRRAEKPDQNSENSSGNSGYSDTLQVVEVYKPTVHVIPIFNAVEVNTNRLFTPSEASDIVFKYVEQQNLVKPINRSIVVLDAILCDALFKGAIKKGSMYPTEIHKKDLGSTFVSRMQANHCVTRGYHSVVRKGALKPIQIMTERRQGNKKVTRLSGLETFLLDPESIASELQKKFACSTTVAELPGELLAVLGWNFSFAGSSLLYAGGFKFLVFPPQICCLLWVRKDYDGSF